MGPPVLLESSGQPRCDPCFRSSSAASVSGCETRRPLGAGCGSAPDRVFVTELGWLVADGLDVVPVGLENVGAVIVRVIDPARARRAPASRPAAWHASTVP